MNDEKIIGANKGGCWWCGKIAPRNNLYFSQEFDTNAHEICAENALAKDPEDTEAILIHSCIVHDHFSPYIKENRGYAE